MFAFLLILGVSYFFVANSLVGLVGDSLYDEYKKQDMMTAARLSLQLEASFAASDSSTVQELVDHYAEEQDGRLLITDNAGKIQFDSFHEANGQLFKLPEMVSLLTEGTSSYGIHSSTQEAASFDFLHLFTTETAEYEAICTSELCGEDGRRIGALVFIRSVQEMVIRVHNLQRTVTIDFLIAAAVGILFAFFFAGIITKPITALIKSTNRMAQGDFSTRVTVQSGGELRRLSESFNLMSEKLERLDQSRNQFVSNASHELKTPLATMKILLESIIYQPDMQEEIRTEFLSDIDKEIDRLSSIISDLLTLVSMDSKKLQLNRTDFSFAQLVSDNVHRLDAMTKERKQEVVMQLKDRCNMNADSGKLAQVVYNITENASKYSPEGSTIKVRLVRSGNMAVLSITDNGPGIPKEDQPHIFDRFYRVDKARSRETGGTGLGLSIVHQMVLMHGGTVNVDSEVGKGSTFTVELPVT